MCCSHMCCSSRELAEKEKVARDRPKVETRDVEEDSDTLESTPSTRRARRRGSFRVTGKDHRAERHGGACALEYAGVSACVSISRVFNSGPRVTARFAPSSASRRILPTRGSTPSVVIAPTYLTAEEREKEKDQSRESRTKFRRHAASRRSKILLFCFSSTYVRKRDLVVSFL